MDRERESRRTRRLEHLGISLLAWSSAVLAITGGCAKKPQCEFTSSVFLGPKVKGELPDVSERPELEESLMKSGRSLAADVRICVDDTGEVRKVTLVSGTGDRPFDGIVVERVKEWTYCPANPPRRELVCEDVALRWPRVAVVKDTYASPTRPSDTPRIHAVPERPRPVSEQPRSPR